MPASGSAATTWPVFSVTTSAGVSAGVTTSGVATTSSRVGAGCSVKPALFNTPTVSVGSVTLDVLLDSITASTGEEDEAVPLATVPPTIALVSKSLTS